MAKHKIERANGNWIKVAWIILGALFESVEKQSTLHKYGNDVGAGLQHYNVASGGSSCR